MPHYDNTEEKKSKGKRQRVPDDMPPSDLSEGMDNQYKRPSEYIEDIEDGDKGAWNQLHANRKDAIMRDRDFRDRHTDFDTAEWLVDLTSTETDEEGIPAHNDIRKICEDLLGVLLPNFPTAKLEAGEYVVDPRKPEEEKRVLLENAQEMEETANEIVQGCKKRSDYDKARTRIIYDSVVNGVGYAHPRIEQMASRRDDPQVDHLMSKNVWTLSDLERMSTLSQYPKTGHVESREIFWRSGVRSVEDDEMTRVSRHRVVDVQWARDYYRDNEIKGAPPEYDETDINSGTSLYLQRDEDDEEVEHDQVGLVETWEIEEFTVTPKKKFFMGPGQAKNMTWDDSVKDAIMVYTCITADKCLDYQVYSSDETVMELPFIPYYVKRSKEHPYGFSIPLMLELQQMFVNRLRALLMKQQMNSVAPQAVAVMLQALGAGDREQIESAIEEGGVAWLGGAGSDVVDIKQVMQPMNHSSPAANPAIVQMLQSEKKQMQSQGQVLSSRELGRSRSAAGKAQMMNANDRPKGYSILLLGNAEKDHTERLWHLNRKNVGGKTVPVAVGRGASAGKVLNEKVKKRIPHLGPDGRPVRTEAFKTPSNEEGIVYRERTFKKNDTSIPLHAVASNQSNLPTDIMARLRLADALSKAELLKSPKTAREMVLDERLEALDDMNAAKDEGDQKKKAQKKPKMSGEQNKRMMRMLQGYKRGMEKGGGGGEQQGGGSQGGEVGSSRQQESATPGSASRAPGGAGDVMGGLDTLPQNQVGQDRTSPQEEIARSKS